MSYFLQDTGIKLKALTSMQYTAQVANYAMKTFLN